MINDPKQLKKVRLTMWLNTILLNIDNIKKEIEANEDVNYDNIINDVKEQYRLIRLMKNVLDGKTRLDGWKTEKE